MNYKLFTDGGARGNPGPAGIGAVLKDKKDLVIFELSKFIGETTNNVAEYRAVLYGLYVFPKATEIVSDSQLVVKQLNGEYATKQDHLKLLAEKVLRRVKNQGRGCKFTWVPRGDNPAGRVLG